MPTFVTEMLWQAAKAVFEQWAATEKGPLRLIGFRAENLEAKEGGQLLLFNDQKDEKQKVIIMFSSFVPLYIHFSYLILVKKINRIIHDSHFTSISNNSDNIYRYASSDNNMFLNAQGNHYLELVKIPKDSKTKLSSTLML